MIFVQNRECKLHLIQPATHHILRKRKHFIFFLLLLQFNEEHFTLSPRLGSCRNRSYMIDAGMFFLISLNNVRKQQTLTFRFSTELRVLRSSRNYICMSSRVKKVRLTILNGYRVWQITEKDRWVHQDKPDEKNNSKAK